MIGKGMTFEEKLASGYYIRDAKPKRVAVVTVPVSHSDAKVIAENPESVRVHARRADGVSVIARPQSNPNCVTVRTDLVREIDGHGRPVWDDPGQVTHEYHPWSGLRR